MRHALFAVFSPLTMVMVLLLGILVPISHAAEGDTTLTWYGQSAFKLVTPKGKVLLIDPWIVNPGNPQGQADLGALKQVDLILVSHGHFDHVGQAAPIAKATQAKLVTTYDLGRAMVQHAGYPEALAGLDTLGNYGGTLTLLGGEVKVTFIAARHSSGICEKELGVSQNPEIFYAGEPTGFLIEIANGPSIYHTGDTDIHGGMKRLNVRHGKHKQVDVMLACIGDHFTMGPRDAALATQWVNPKVVVPMHYGLFPELLTGTADAFEGALKTHRLSGRMTVLTPRTPWVVPATP